MTSQPDKLFREKLENFQRPAPVGAWDKIETNLARPNNKVIWMRIAAGIALLTAAAIVLWPAQEEKERIAIKQDQLPVIKNDDPVKQQPTPVNKEETSVNKTSVAKTERTPVKKQTTAPVAPEKKQTLQEPVVIPIPQQELVAEVVVPETTETSTTLVYTVAEVNSKFLKKKLPIEATPDNKDASGIQKLIGLAYAAKNSETGLGELRQKKDDLLALSFGKNKGEN